MKKYEEIIKQVLEDKMNLSQIVLESPKDSTHGDISLPCFSVAKKLKRLKMIFEK